MKPLLYGWEVSLVLNDAKDPQKRTRMRLIVATETLDQVLTFLSADRADAANEIESIIRFGPILEVIREPKEKETK